MTFTNLFPGGDMPRHGIFVEERLRHLVATGELEARVIALRPARPGFADARHKSKEKRTEVRNGITVDYQTVPTLRMVSNWIDPWTWAAAAEPAVRNALRQSATPSILDAHFLYPDGVAAVILGRRLGLPVVLSARGSDVNVKCLNPVMKRWVQWAAARSAAIITVSQALATRIAELEIEPPILEVIPNGVDLEKFRPRDKEQSRGRFGVAGRLIASVGHLVPDKGHQFAVEALAQLPETNLLIVGEGPQKSYLQSQARKLGVSERVHFPGLLPHADMPYLYSAADALVLASAREGMPNVVLESLACGTRVVATDVGGIREIVRSDEAGALITDRSAKGLLEGLARVEATPMPAQATREYAVQFGWQNIIGNQISLYQTVLANFVN
ncbi:MAG: glycosyltransferase [Woeseia sp.]